MIEHSEMVKTLAKNGQDIINDLTPESAHMLHMAVGLCGEVSELSESLRDGEDNMLEEFGDAEFYFEGLQQGVGLNIDENHHDPLFNDWSVRGLSESLLITAGNILDIVKKHSVYAKPLDVEILTLSMLDLRANLTAMYEHSEIKCSSYMAKAANVQKLGKRYEGFIYSNHAAQSRADKAD